MNRLYTLLYMTALAATAFGQKTDPQFRQLEDWLRGQGYVVAFYQSNDPDNSNNIAYYWNTEFYNRQIDEVVDSTRTTFARVNKEKAESYLYEYHNDGTDTINYSIAFRHGNDRLDYSRSGNSVQFWDAPEAVYFKYQAREKDQIVWGIYKHLYVEPRGILKEDMKPFDVAAFEAHIQPALESMKTVKGAKSWPVYWRHDQDYNADLAYDDKLLVQTKAFHNDSIRAGLTTGTHYFIPAQREAEFMDLRLQLDSLAHDYVNRHPEQPYEYTFIPIVLRILPNHSILKEYPGLFHATGDIVTNSNDSSIMNSYNLRCYRDDDGFHVLSITTEGRLWIPKGWQKMKRWVNGKATYRKN